MNYRVLFDNNSNYYDPTGLLEKEEFNIYLLWVHGINQPDSSELLRIPLGTLKPMQCEIFARLRMKLALRFNIDNRALIPASYSHSIINNENSVLPKEVTDWIIKNKPL